MAASVSSATRLTSASGGSWANAGCIESASGNKTRDDNSVRSMVVLIEFMASERMDNVNGRGFFGLTGARCAAALTATSRPGGSASFLIRLRGRLAVVEQVAPVLQIRVAQVPVPVQGGGVE